MMELMENIENEYNTKISNLKQSNFEKLSQSQQEIELLQESKVICEIENDKIRNENIDLKKQLQYFKN